jgi:hypothetical protein
MNGQQNIKIEKQFFLDSQKEVYYTRARLSRLLISWNEEVSNQLCKRVFWIADEK